MSLSLVILIATAFALSGASAWLWLLARGKERGEGLNLRLHAEGGREEAELALTSADARKPRDPLTAALAGLFWRAGLEASSSRVALFALLLLAVAAAAGAAGGIWVGVGAAGGLLLLAYAVLQQLAARRRRRIIEQLPNFLESVIRVLAAGNSLEESFASAAREAVDPIRPLFVSVARQVRLGAPIDQVLTAAGTLYRLRDLRVLGLAASTNRRYGGSIRNVLKSLITAIRQRSMAERELKALTAETRFSAIVLAVVPIGLSAFIFSRNASYYISMYHDPSGRNLILASLGMQVAGTLLLWRMLKSTEGAQA